MDTLCDAYVLVNRARLVHCRSFVCIDGQEGGETAMFCVDGQSLSVGYGRSDLD